MTTSNMMGEEIKGSEAADGGPMIFLMGATATGKTDLALELAERFSMEIVNADSVQVYRGMDIGSAKPALEERRGVVHHLLDVAEPDDPYSAGRFRRAVVEVAEDCRSRGVVPMLVGGTGLYFRAVEHGLAPTPPVDEAIRRRLERQADKEGLLGLHAQLVKVDPQFARKVTTGDRQRIVRGLVVAESSGRILSAWQQDQPPTPRPKYSILKLAIHLPKIQLWERIEQRFKQMVESGLVEEATALRNRGLDRALPAMKSVGYRQIFDYLDGRGSLEEAIQRGIYATRQYAKRQGTWLRKVEGVHWFSNDEREQAIQLTEAFLSKERDMGK
ncbi:MAG: tRNA (adenosine(37)-N6)-dimethylallyltransferase MiaA [Magnetococcales bacterium]|nr:tRNA (adenosine(37)-N6)-dimethylallyltransferase MiaA [Magnetococcales bacterium]